MQDLFGEREELDIQTADRAAPLAARMRPRTLEEFVGQEHILAPGALGYGLAGMPELAPVSGVPVVGFDSMPQTIPEGESQKSQLAQWEKEIAQAGLKVTLHQPTGAVAEEILNQADAINADLLVMGTHGHGAMYHLLVGSATKGVLKHATRPVLLVPSPKS